MKRAILATITTVLMTFALMLTSATPTIQAASISSENTIIQHINQLVVGMTLTDLIQGSDAILIGTVLEILPSRGDIVSHTYTDAVIRPERYLYGGSGNQNIAVRILGGASGNITLWVEDQPEFKVGEEVLLFLRRLTLATPEGIAPQNYYEVCGVFQGKWDYKDGVAASITGEKMSVVALEEIIAASGVASIQMAVTIDGLRSGEQAVLRIGPETASLESADPLFEYTLQGPVTNLTVDIRPTLKDGYYLLLLEAPQKYHRYPKGYAFMVSDSAIINPTGKAITFSLAPPPIYPEMEAVISLSALTKEPMPIPKIPLWQRLLEPLAITGAVIIAGLIGVVFWRVARKRRMIR
jgi:hypothetical protein